MSESDVLTDDEVTDDEVEDGDDLPVEGEEPEPEPKRRRWRPRLRRRGRRSGGSEGKVPGSSRNRREWVWRIVTPRRFRAGLYLFIFLGFVGGVGTLWRILPFDDKPPPMPSLTAAQISEAARGRVPNSWVVGYDPDPFGWQVHVTTGGRNCWKVAVITDGGRAFAAAGAPAKVGCRPVPVADRLGSDANPEVEKTARDFLREYTSDGDVRRWVDPSLEFPLPPPGELKVFDVKQVSEVRGPIRFAVVTGTLDGRDVQYRLSLTRGPNGWLIDHVAAGPAVDDVETDFPVDTAPPPTPMDTPE